MIKKVLSVIILAGVMLTSFTACGNSVKIDDPVTVNDVHMSSSNVARGFIQSVFSKDETLFYACYPEGLYDEIIEEGNDPFAEYTNTTDPNYKFYGTQYTAYNDYTEENGYDEDIMRENIAFFHDLDESLIAEINIVKLRVYFIEDTDYVSSDVYLITYKYENSWYVYELQNADAEFEA
ncbi:MAG: hypothetical protein II718_00535 [Clostridiales bacterium]|nr:hypothetical protein [Clostridiales bacterium]